LLDTCRAGKDPDEAMRLYTVTTAELAARCIPSIAADKRAILDGTSALGNREHPVYRNHGGMLPNSGSYFLEYYAGDCSLMPTGTDVRIVYDKPNQIFYVTGTHYRAFMSPYSNVLRNAFYRVVD
jgi:hypothetical protein